MIRDYVPEGYYNEFELAGVTGYARKAAYMRAVSRELVMCGGACVSWLSSRQESRFQRRWQSTWRLTAS